MNRTTFFIFLVLGLTLGACQSKKSTPQPEEQAAKSQNESDTIRLTGEQLALMHIEIGLPSEKKVAYETLRAIGKISILANNTAEISAQFKGRIDKIFVHEGEFIKKGEPLVVISSTEIIQIQREYLTAKSEIYFLEKELERQRILSAAQVGATKNMQETESKLLAQRAILKSDEAILTVLKVPVPNSAESITTKITLFAPFEGYLGHLNVSIGSTVDNGSKLLSIKNFSDPHVDIMVYEQDLQSIEPKGDVQFIFNDPEQTKASGKIEHIGREIDSTTHTVTLHVELKTPKNKILATDMLVTALLQKMPSLEKVLPLSALSIDTDNNTYYFRAQKENATDFIFLKTRAEKSQETPQGVVVKNLDLKQQIVVRGASILLSHSKRSEMKS